MIRIELIWLALGASAASSNINNIHKVLDLFCW